jgi:magnesium transporter
MPRHHWAAATATLATRRREEVLALAGHAPGTAGALMTSRYAGLPAGMTASEAIRRLAADGEAETVYRSCVVDDRRHLLGAVELRDLLRAEPLTPVSDLMSAEPEFAFVDDNDEAAARRLLDAPLMVLPVIDRERRVVGIITFDDAHRLLERANREDSQLFNALSGEAADTGYLDVPLFQEIRRRAPWIVALAIVGLLAGYIVHVYEEALDALVILALYMPMLADTGGNVGTQSASLVIRAIATGDVGTRQTARVLWKEMRVALVLALMLFAFAYLKVQFLSNAADVPDGLTLEMIALAIGIAIAVQVFLSTLIGACLPVLALVVRQDPAVVAGPALTTIVDVVGLLLYFAITTSMLGVAVH